MKSGPATGPEPAGPLAALHGSAETLDTRLNSLCVVVSHVTGTVVPGQAPETGTAAIANSLNRLAQAVQLARPRWTACPGLPGPFVDSADRTRARRRQRRRLIRIRTLHLRTAGSGRSRALETAARPSQVITRTGRRKRQQLHLRGFIGAANNACAAWLGRRNCVRLQGVRSTPAILLTRIFAPRPRCGRRHFHDGLGAFEVLGFP